MKKINIRLIKENEIAAAAQVFANAFNAADIDEEWTNESAIEYLNYWFKRKGDLFFVALEENKIIGGALGDIIPYYDGQYFADGELFVDPNHQESGIGKTLIKRIITEAIKKYQIKYVSWLASLKTSFPISWYERLGLKKTKWILMEGEAKKVLQNLK